MYHRVIAPFFIWYFMEAWTWLSQKPKPCSLSYVEALPHFKSVEHSSFPFSAYLRECCESPVFMRGTPRWPNPSDREGEFKWCHVKCSFERPGCFFFFYTDSGITSNSCTHGKSLWRQGSLLLSHNYLIWLMSGDDPLSQHAASFCHVLLVWTKRSWSITDTVWFLKRLHLRSACWGWLAWACSGMASGSSQS